MKTPWFISTAVLVIGVILGMGVQALLRDDPATAPHSDAGTPPGLLAATPTVAVQPAMNMQYLEETLQKEIAARQQLTQTVARLEKELHEMKTQLAARPAPAATVAAAPAAAPPPQDTTHSNEPVFDEDALRAAGLSMTMVKQTRERFEQLEMDRLFLRDRAIREGWMGTTRYTAEVEKLEGRREDINNSLGDDGYDAYLYATNQPNRVLIREMLQGSPAKAAGLQSGDMVLNYDGKRMFTTRDLQTATTGGPAGESVPVRIQRNGQIMDLYIPRGPLGVYLDADSVKP